MKILIYLALFMVSALALAQSNMNGAPEVLNPETPNQNEAIESDAGMSQEEMDARQEMEDLNQENIEGLENQDSPSDMSTVPETTPSF